MSSLANAGEVTALQSSRPAGSERPGFEPSRQTKRMFGEVGLTAASK
eukprot:CAMPEP_0168710562 /NCGR_PEP_ID=MMETSP0503-20121227/42706_1 /TAXON_ID=89963 /ORGANISM="Heterocapsa rotundata, Strain SCCAP K-0483" /LENGTH=46 /DNA_ID= /DNA_START= /DNA_END= /DNA_ORIENTATION=